ncbi:unnamed protein product [Rotaria socialis]|uniref:Innexin n=3 Tax=Rotaria socialis TaxID=392032 RepID=A0A818TPP6_9BILA|nr:unnamed protein product [Rotaria socialis]CAF3590695.1 unnamed protein product [Rotaria socialis]CAF3687454.1 unnamed protein product [Rotaria socialis]CAF4207695.1 unnamed protein product [Rotaria socialis]CAF4696961.1 unnamed protein product [Rotaria socialis]
MELVRTLAGLSVSSIRQFRDDDSYIDRLNHRYTTTLCVVFAILVTTKQYAGDPIDCWVPAQFKPSYEAYTDSYCWIANTYYIPIDEELPDEESARRNKDILYYQWVPFILLFQAFLFYFPRIVWRTLNVKSGLDLVNLVDAAVKYEQVEQYESRDRIMSYLIINIERYISARAHLIRHRIDKQYSWARRFFHLFFFCSNRHYGNYLVIVYFLVKLLWLVNALAQLFLLNTILGNDYYLFGFEVIEKLFKNQRWTENRHFPKVTYCDFKIREIGVNHFYTVQCVLRINLFNEVIFIIQWFWLISISAATIYDFLLWLYNCTVSREKVRFIKRHLGIMSPFNPKEERQEARDFVLHYLKDDGVLLTRLLSLNSSDLVVTEIINQLWIRYKTVNQLYSTVNTQRPNSNIPNTEIINNENNVNTSTLGTDINYENANTNNHRQRSSHMPSLLLSSTNKTYHHYSKSEKSENKSSKDTDV